MRFIYLSFLFFSLSGADFSFSPLITSIKKIHSVLNFSPSELSSEFSFHNFFTKKQYLSSQSSLSETFLEKQKKVQEEKSKQNTSLDRNKNLSQKESKDSSVSDEKEKPFSGQESIPELGKKIFDRIQFDSVFKNNKNNAKGPAKDPGCTKELAIRDIIGPATLDILEHAIRLTQKDQCSSLLLLINTPGGNLLSTRKMVEAILNSPVPVLCLVYPGGAHAGSAGAIIMQACHVNGAVAATNIGAATPITGSGKDIPKDLRKKMMNDATSWLDGLTNLRKRNKKFGREIITEAKALSGKEAHKIGAIDFYGQAIEEFLIFARGRKVQVKDIENVQVQVGKIQTIPLGARYQLINFVTDPQMVYLLFLGSLILLYFEITHPGTIVPGVLGVMGLVISFIGMHKLNFVWGGLFLILLGVIFMILEAFISGFGILGGAGAISFIVGSFFLFDPSKTGGLAIPTFTIIAASVVFISITMVLAYLAYTALRKKKKGWIGEKGEVVELQTPLNGFIEINGETWKFRSKEPLKKGDTVKIVCYKKMIFDVVKDD